MDEGLCYGKGLNVYMHVENERTRSLTTIVLPLVIKYAVVTRCRSPVDRVAGQVGLTIQASCLKKYGHLPFGEIQSAHIT